MATYFKWMLDPKPTSFATIMAYSQVWVFYGAATAAYIVAGGLAGVIMALFLLIPMPGLVYLTLWFIKRDKRTVNSLGTA